MANVAASTIVGQISSAEQVRCVEECRLVLALAPLVRPATPGGAPMRVRVSAAGQVGWVGKGSYHYSHEQESGHLWPPLPKLWHDIASAAVGEEHPWDCAIINWYDADASLGWHRDLAEKDRSKPIVTISIGDACSWAVRVDDDSPITRTRLESGDITVLEGRTRLALHAVERIIPSPMFNPLRSPGRISITMRVAT